MENSENKYSFDPTILKALIDQGPDFFYSTVTLFAKFLGWSTLLPRNVAI